MIVNDIVDTKREQPVVADFSMSQNSPRGTGQNPGKLVQDDESPAPAWGFVCSPYKAGLTSCQALHRDVR
jgi:hypothetical protein